MTCFFVFCSGLSNQVSRGDIKMDKKTFRMQIGKNIAMLREKAGYTQETLSEKIDVSRSFLAHVEQGERSFSSYKLKILADTLHVSMDSIYYGPSREMKAKEIMKELEDMSTDELEAVHQIIHWAAVLGKKETKWPSHTDC